VCGVRCAVENSAPGKESLEGRGLGFPRFRGGRHDGHVVGLTLGAPIAERMALGFAVGFAEAERKPCSLAWFEGLWKLDGSHRVWCDAVRCGAVRCDAVRCGSQTLILAPVISFSPSLSLPALALASALAPSPSPVTALALALALALASALALALASALTLTLALALALILPSAIALALA
jgi:hypothetical protein